MTAVVQITMNNLMTIYGAQSVYGSDTALSAYGMMMKVYQIAHSMFVGVSSATQPINGYNFGAKLYDRVKQTYKLAAVIALIVSVVWFAIYQLFSKQIGMLFCVWRCALGPGAQHIFRIYMMAFFLYGLHMVTASFFTGNWQAGQSTAHSAFQTGDLSDSAGYHLIWQIWLRRRAVCGAYCGYPGLCLIAGTCGRGVQKLETSADFVKKIISRPVKRNSLHAVAGMSYGLTGYDFPL